MINNTYILPIGSTEYHGELLPTNTDTVIAEKIARGIKKKMQDAIILPAIQLGLSSEHIYMPGTITFSVTEFINEIEKSLIDIPENSIVVVINGHGGNKHIINMLSAEYNYKHDNKKMFAPVLFTNKVKKTAVKLLGDFDSHAGSFESSLLAYYGLIDETLRENDYYVRKMPDALRFFRMDQLSSLGVLKSTNKLVADKQYGERLHNLIVDEVVDSINITRAQINSVLSDRTVNYSLYRMENNTYIKDCLVVVYCASPSEMKNDGLTNNQISMFIKTPKDISKINSIADLTKTKLFVDEKQVLLRVASECLFGIFGDSHCDCESQRIACLESINNYGQGIYIQLPQEGQGRGLHYKARELQLQVNGFDQFGHNVGKKSIYEAADLLLGTDDVDIRHFSVLKKIFRDLGLEKENFVLLSSNPKKISDLSTQTGIEIESASDVEHNINIENVSEYLAKIYKKNCEFMQD
ncbi:MAG: creatininase family protein [Candidatus Nomurabacteria bacterium]|jgi:creatinine amidohydrolase|nr:creatininase family protein [Candidatus Nomurabacteria bacterium]